MRVFWTVSKDEYTEYWATNELKIREEGREKLEKHGLGIEVYHRALKPCCGVERVPVRKGVAILKPFLLSLQAFLRLEIYRLRRGKMWYEGKAAILRDAIQAYLAQLTYELIPTA